MRFIMATCGLKSPNKFKLTLGSKTFASSVKSDKLSLFVEATLNTINMWTAAKSSVGQSGSITFLVTDQLGASTMASHRYCGRKVMTLKAMLTTVGVGSRLASRSASGSAC